ncbi:hypothetical protein CSUB01_09932 [Colletotrichum sublineola]|uniref:Uncharacterized protein n=1 Tax=Colletotrichum sublineola TaxID=1173701 RepID=A0A066WYY3_COLSU|nr:hypothetical protein CSUB01_09932 [Colletotrichum sublineola]
MAKLRLSEQPSCAVPSPTVPPGPRAETGAVMNRDLGPLHGANSPAPPAMLGTWSINGVLIASSTLYLSLSLSLSLYLSTIIPTTKITDNHHAVSSSLTNRRIPDMTPPRHLQTPPNHVPRPGLHAPIRKVHITLPAASGRRSRHINTTTNITASSHDKQACDPSLPHLRIGTGSPLALSIPSPPFRLRNAAWFSAKSWGMVEE